MSQTQSKMNADIFTPGKKSSILKNKRDNISMTDSANAGLPASAAQTQTSNFMNKHGIPALNL